MHIPLKQSLYTSKTRLDSKAPLPDPLGPHKTLLVGNLPIISFVGCFVSNSFNLVCLISIAAVDIMNIPEIICHSIKESKTSSETSDISYADTLNDLSEQQGIIISE